MLGNSHKQIPKQHNLVVEEVASLQTAVDQFMSKKPLKQKDTMLKDPNQEDPVADRMVM